MAAGDEAGQRVTERWTYGGLRLDRSGKRHAAWYDTGRNPLWFKPDGHPIVGGVYQVEVTRDGERATRHGEPVYAGPDPDRAWTAQLQAEDRVAQAKLATAARERNDARSTALDEAIAPLEEIAERFVNPADLDALAAFVIRRLITANWRARRR